MEIFTAPRGGGKTTLCLAWLKSVPNGILVVHTEKEAKRLAKIAGVNQFYVRSYSQVKQLLPHRDSVLAIDNVDLCVNLPHGLTFDDLTESGIQKVIPEYIYDLPVNLVTYTKPSPTKFHSGGIVR